MWFEKNNKLALLLGKIQLCLPFSLLREKKRIIIHPPKELLFTKV